MNAAFTLLGCIWWWCILYLLYRWQYWICEFIAESDNRRKNERNLRGTSNAKLEWQRCCWVRILLVYFLYFRFLTQIPKWSLLRTFQASSWYFSCATFWLSLSTFLSSCQLPSPLWHRLQTYWSHSTRPSISSFTSSTGKSFRGYFCKCFATLNKRTKWFIDTLLLHQTEWRKVALWKTVLAEAIHNGCKRN